MMYLPRRITVLKKATLSTFFSQLFQVALGLQVVSSLTKSTEFVNVLGGTGSP
jgi:hypothetical protein